MSQDLFTTVTAIDLDSAIDQAACRCSAIVSEFAATIGRNASGQQALELSIEFFIAPLSMEHFGELFEEELMTVRLGYAAARHRDELQLPMIQLVAPGAFHQWRVAWRKSLPWQRDNRWSRSRELLDGVNSQSRLGWREIAIA